MSLPSPAEIAAALIAREELPAEKGDIGPEGKAGEFGPPGPQGAKGDPGRNGTNGTNGNVGPKGPQGNGGPRGPKGEKGDKGDKGDEGERGPIGPMGPTGAVGSGKALFPRPGGGSSGGAPSGAAGGQLAGTYPDPTVAASHSGSTHAATQAAAEATAASGLSAHTGDTSDAHDASAVSVSPTVAGADNVQDALEGLEPLAERAMNIIGPFTVNWNSANVLTTGVALFTGEAGYVIYNMWFEVATDFAGTGGWDHTEFELFTANDVLHAAEENYFYVQTGYVDDGTDVAKLWIGDLLAMTLGTPAENWFPARMKVTTPILLKMVVPTGSMTAGVLKVYAMVGELP